MTMKSTVYVQQTHLIGRNEDGSIKGTNVGFQAVDGAGFLPAGALLMVPMSDASKLDTTGATAYEIEIRPVK